MKKEILDITKEILKQEPIKKGIMVKHPFTTNLIFEGRDITENKDAFDAFVAATEEKIDNCRTLRELMELVEPSYRDFWLLMCKSQMSNREFSKLAGAIKLKDADFLKNANKKYLMTERELSVMDNLPNTMTMYKVGSIWTRKKETALKRAKINGDKEILKTKIPKKSVHCYYEDLEGFVITPERIDSVAV